MTFPVDLFIIDDIQITDKNAVLTNDTRSLQFRARKIPGQRWEVKLQTRATPDNRKAAIGYASTLQGGVTVETIVLPYFSESLAGVKLVNQGVAVGASSVNLQESVDVNVGDYFKFAGHSKVYIVKSKLGLNIKFHPNLVRAVAPSEQVIFNNVPMTVQSMNNAQVFGSSGRYAMLNVDFNFVEVIS